MKDLFARNKSLSSVTAFIFHLIIFLTPLCYGFCMLL